MIDKVRLGDVVEFQRGYDLPHASVVSGPYPVIASTSVFAYHNEFKAEDGIVIGRSGTVGQPQLVRGKFWPHNTTLFTTDIKGNNLEYLYYCLVNLDIGKMKTGSNIPTLNRNDLYPLEIPFETDVATQQKIAEILSAIDAKIDNNNAICADLEGMAKLLYDYWFVQFDFPDENGKPYKSSGGKMVWNEELKREIPEGWEAKPLSDWLLCNKHSLGQNDHYDYIEYLDTSSLTKNAISFLQHITDADAFPVRAKRIIFHNDILYSTVRPEQQHFGIIKNPPKDLIASTGFAVLSCKEGAEYNDLFYLFLSSDSITNILNTIANSSVSAYPSIVPGDILKLKICLPKKLDETSFALEKFQTLFTTTDELHKENATLTSLRDFLLPMLMNGQVKVKEA